MKIALVSSHGGHLTQILKMKDAFRNHDIFFVTYTSSRNKEVSRIAPAYFCRNIGYHPHLLLWTFFLALRILLRERPQVIFSTGSEIALPFIFWAKLFKIKTFFVESLSCITEPTLTGRLVYPFVDEYWVQWPDMLAVCGPKAKYHGAVL